MPAAANSKETEPPASRKEKELKERLIYPQHEQRVRG
jgi:hypothetical protein